VVAIPTHRVAIRTAAERGTVDVGGRGLREEPGEVCFVLERPDHGEVQLVVRNQVAGDARSEEHTSELQSL
jgi:hypothetical protein